MAGPAVGTLGQLGIDTSSPVGYRFDFQSEALRRQDDLADGNGNRGTRSRHINRVKNSLQRITGPISFQPNAVEWALLLPWCLGANASGTTYALADTLQTRYVAIDRKGKVFTYSGVGVDTATIRCGQGEICSLEVGLVAVSETLGNSGTFPSLSIDETTDPFILSECVVTVGGTTIPVKEFEIAINNMIDKDRFFNSNTLSAIVALDREISFKTTLPYGDYESLYYSGGGADGVAVVANFTSGNTSLSFSMVKVAIPPMSPGIEGRSEIMLNLEGKAYETSSTKELVVTLDSTP